MIYYMCQLNDAICILAHRTCTTQYFNRHWVRRVRVGRRGADVDLAEEALVQGAAATETIHPEERERVVATIHGTWEELPLPRHGLP